MSRPYCWTTMLVAAPTVGAARHRVHDTTEVAMKVNWTSTGVVEWGGQNYAWKSGLVETDYGPEMVVEVCGPCGDNAADRRTWKYSECAGTATILGWWKQEMAEEARYASEYDPAEELSEAQCDELDRQYLEYMKGEEQ